MQAAYDFFYTVCLYCFSFQEVLRYAEDIEIDIPKIWQYLGELMAMTVMDGSIPLRLLKSFCKPLTNLEKSSLVVAVIIEIITENMVSVNILECQ